MLDLVNGKVRARKWPQKRGKKATLAQQEQREKFRKAQVAYRYIAPTMAKDLEAATRQTPLYPRDILTSILYNRFVSFRLADGKVRYPMTSRNDVSAALDAITQTEGATLVRGTDYWEGGAQPDSGSVEVISEIEITGSGNYRDFPDFDPTRFMLRCGSKT
jgi:hypothetical protein